MPTPLNHQPDAFPRPFLDVSLFVVGGARQERRRDDSSGKRGPPTWTGRGRLAYLTLSLER